MNFLVKKKEELSRLEEEALASLYRRPDLTEGTYLFYYESRRVYFATHLGKDGEVEEIVGINDPYLKEAFKKELDAYLGKTQGEKPKAVEPKMEAPVAPVLLLPEAKEEPKPVLSSGAPLIRLEGFSYRKGEKEIGPLDYSFGLGYNAIDDLDGSIFQAVTLAFNSKVGGHLYYGETEWKEDSNDSVPYVLDLKVSGVGSFSLVYLLTGTVYEKEKKAFLISSAFKGLRKYKYGTPEERKAKAEAFIEVVRENAPLALVYDSSLKENEGEGLVKLFETAPFVVLALKEKEAKKTEAVTKKENAPKVPLSKQIPYVLSIYRNYAIFAVMLFLSSVLVCFALMLVAYLFMDDKGALASSLIVCALILFPINALLASSLHSYLVEDGKKEPILYFENFLMMELCNLLGAGLAFGLFQLLRISGLSFLEAPPEYSFYLAYGVGLMAMFIAPFFARLFVPFVSNKEKLEALEKEEAEGR